MPIAEQTHSFNGSMTDFSANDRFEYSDSNLGTQMSGLSLTSTTM